MLQNPTPFRFILLVAMISLLISCSPRITPAVTAAIKADLALVNATLIDGTGADPLPDAVVLIKGDRIVAVGPREEVKFGPEFKTIDLQGATILPGFINAHVHSYNERTLENWAQGGVTTVRDEGILSTRPLADLMKVRDKTRADPKYARMVSAGYMITVPRGYGNLFVVSADDARKKANEELDAGVDMIKISLEDGYFDRSGLPKLTDDEIAAIVAVAHERGTKVSGHITRGAYLERMVNAGVDDVAHIPWTAIDPAVLKRMVEKDIYFTSTFTAFRNGVPVEQCIVNLSQFIQLGGHVALGDDYGGDRSNSNNNFELGIPMYEIKMMTYAGMTPMQIIVASTLNAAHVLNLEKELGTLEVGKAADIWVVNGNPLENLQALTNIRMVIRSGVIIRDETLE
jgi:imidazolonepropionase-like amidohydrolase